MRYTLEPIWKKSVVDVENWYKQDGDRRLWFEREHGWRWGSASFDCNEFPDIDLENEYGINVIEDLPEDAEPDLDYDDGCWTTNNYCDDLTEEEQQELEYMDHEELEENGWILHFVDTIYTGPLKLTDETGKEWRGDESE